MSDSSAKNAPLAPYVEDCSDYSQDEISEPRPPPNSARKVTRRDEASDSGYSSRTHATGSSTASVKAAAPPSKPSSRSSSKLPPKLSSKSSSRKSDGVLNKMAKKVSSSTATKKATAAAAVKETATATAASATSKEADDVAVESPTEEAPAEERKIRSILKSSKKGSSHRRRSVGGEARDESTRKKLSAEASKPRPSTARLAGHGPFQPPPPPTMVPLPGAIPILRPPQRVAPHGGLPLHRPQSYHAGMPFAPFSLPIQPGPMMFGPPGAPVISQMEIPGQIIQPQPAPLPFNSQPPPHGGFFIQPSGPSSPSSRQTEYEFPRSRPRRRSELRYLEDRSESGYWEREPEAERYPREERRIRSDNHRYSRNVNVPVYPPIPKQLSKPRTQRSYGAESAHYPEAMTRSVSYEHGSRRHSAALYRPRHELSGDIFPYEDEEEDDSDEYARSLSRDHWLREDRLYRDKLAMPPPPLPTSRRPHYARAETTGELHRSASRRDRYQNSHSLEYSMPPVHRRSLDGGRPAPSTHSSGSGRLATLGHYMPEERHYLPPEAPSTPMASRRQRPVSINSYGGGSLEHYSGYAGAHLGGHYDVQERAAEMYQEQQAPSPNVTREEVENQTRRALKAKATTRSGRSETNSHASSRSERRSSRRLLSPETDSMTIRTKGMSINVKGPGEISMDEDGKVAFRPAGIGRGEGGGGVAIGDTSSRGARSQSYHISGSTDAETEVHRSGGARVRGRKEPMEAGGSPASNVAVQRLKTGSKPSSRRSSKVRQAYVQASADESGIPFGPW